MTALDDIEARIREIAAGVTGDIGEIVDKHLPVIHEAAQTLAQLTQSKTVTEIVRLAGGLDPELDTALAAIVKASGEAAEKIAELTAPEPSDPVGVDEDQADPAPAA